MLCSCRWQLTLQPEWRKQAKEAGATDITCENGDPFYMIIKQLNSVIIGWIENGVNDLIIHPVNKEIVHELNSFIGDIPLPDFDKLKNSAEDFGDDVGDTLKDIANAANPGNWFRSRRLDELDDYSQMVYNRTDHGRRLAGYAAKGFSLRPASGRAPRVTNGHGRRAQDNAYNSQTTAQQRAQSAAKAAAGYNTRPPPPPAKEDEYPNNLYSGKAGNGLPYVPYLPTVCIPDALQPSKCVNGGITQEERKAFDQCESEHLAGGLDLLCCALCHSNLLLTT